MIAQNWRNELKRKQGEQVFLDAMRGYATGTLGINRRSLFVTHILSVLILLTPLLVGALGVVFIVANLPSWGGLFFGGLLVAAGYVLLPARYRMPEKALTRDTAPVLFAQLDEISDALDAPKINHVIVTDDFNAFVVQQGRKTILGLGALLWEATQPKEKVALVAHEVAHLVNNDPARGRIVHYALETLARWEDLVAPGWDGNVFADVALLPFRLLLAGLEQALLRPMFLQSQRAEYLADALAAEIAGHDAIDQLLETVSLGDCLQQEWNKLHGLDRASGRGVIHRLMACLQDMNPQHRADALAKADAEKLSVDATHPPSAYRKAFVKTVASEGTRVRSDLFEKEDPAMADRLHAIGEKLALRFDNQ